MKKLSIVFLILINSLACSNGQSKQNFNNANLSTEILGCWRLVDITYDIKSNYSFVDSLISKNRQDLIEEIKETSFITKFFDNTMNEYDENGTPDNNPSSYTIQGDSIFSRGMFRQDKFSAKITMINDTLCIEENASNELKRIFYDLKRRNKIILPQDIKVEKIIRHVICVRVPDCDQYKKEDE